MKVGDYVRTKDDLNIQFICKIEKIIDKYCVYTDIGYWDEKYIVKSSPNIIDLIEVGDYVNGYKVTSKDQFLGFGNYDWYMTNNDEIKSIVTKERFESMEYKIGE